MNIGKLLAGLAIVAVAVGASASAQAGDIRISVKNSTSKTVSIESQGDPGHVMTDAWDNQISVGGTGPAAAYFSGVQGNTAWVYYTDNPADYLSGKTCYFRWEMDSSGVTYCKPKIYYYALGSGGAQCSGTITSSDMFKCDMTVQFTMR